MRHGPGDEVHQDGRFSMAGRHIDDEAIALAEEDVLELTDHRFIVTLTANGGDSGERLAVLGFEEGFDKDHEGG